MKRGSYAGIWTPQSCGHPSKYWWGSMLLSLEILVNSSKKEEERKKKVGYKVASNRGD